jgi:hypothetical protein
MNQYRFLGIGINAYTQSPLNGCLSDIKLAYKSAKEKLGCNSFKILSEKEATRKHVILALKDSLQGLKPGDKVYIHYSGHGSYQPCTNKTASSETDNYDEGWHVYDSDANGLLIDDELHNIVCNINPKVSVVVCSDSCFSGSVLRAAPNPNIKWKNRFMPPTLSLLLSTGEIDLDDELLPKISRHSRGPAQLRPFIVDTGNKQNNVILISGCGEHQTSADAYIPQLNRYHGALTYNLFVTLAENNWKINYADLIIKVNEKLKNEDYEQVSQLECKTALMKKNFFE